MLMASFIAVACGDDGSDTNGGDGGSSSAPVCFDYASFNATDPTVVFKADVLPILQGSCTLGASCHGAEAGSGGKVYLGPPQGTEPTDAQLTAIETQTVDVDSSIASGLKLIDRDDPSKSFLMHKIDGTFSCGDLSCSGAACGLRMPLGQAPLESAKADVIRRWIAQGAAFL
jgi:hypothetical protein